MNTSHNPKDFHPDEWAARVQLAACYRIFDMLGWTHMIFNHITLRVPGTRRQPAVAPHNEPTEPRDRGGFMRNGLPARGTNDSWCS